MQQYKAHKHTVEQKRCEEHTMCFCLYKIREQVKLVCGNTVI